MEGENREYTNGEITVYWRPGKCVHATTCYRELIEVFNPRKRPWVNMMGAPSERIIEIVSKCPTDALTYKWNDEEKNKELGNAKNDKIKSALSAPVTSSPIKPVTVQVMRDGPLVVQGSFDVYNEKGEKLKHMAMTSFCRCGASNNPPFCDGFHRKIGFSSEK
jgi:uncharacterized Fe-S cluster protein YjdI